jgi:hypothetical protein
MEKKDLPQSFRLVIDNIIGQNLEGTVDCFTQDGSFRDPSGSWQGKDGLRTFFTVGFQSTRETVWEVHQWFQEDNLLCVEWTYGFTLSAGPFKDKKTLFDGLSIVELRQGKIHRWRDYWDSADFLQQVGAKEWGEVIPPDLIAHFFQEAP